MKIIIVGHGIAAESAAKQLVKRSYDVTIISKEKYSPFYRARILELLDGKAIDDIKIKSNIDVIQNEVVKIDRESKSLLLKDGKTISYDKLILATGSSARRLNVESDNILYIRDIDDVLNLKAKLDKSKEVAILGGGLLGLELACKVSKYINREVTVFESAPSLLPRQFLKPEGDYLVDRLREYGVNVVLNSKGCKIEHGVKIKLLSGEEYNFDLLAVSIGTVANTSLARDAKLNVNSAIVVNEKLQTSDEDIYALGDAAEFNGSNPMMIQTALDMARVILDDNKSYTPSASSALLKIENLDVISIGELDPTLDRHEVVSDETKEVFMLSGNVLKSYFAVGTAKSFVKAKLLLNKPLDSEALKEFNITL